MRKRRILPVMLSLAMIFSSLNLQTIMAEPDSAVQITEENTDLEEQTVSMPQSASNVTETITTMLNGEEATLPVFRSSQFGHMDSGIKAENPSEVSDELPVGAEIPAAFNLANEGLVTGVRDQSHYGTCWAFAATGSIESEMIKNHGASSSLDLSDLATAYFTKERIYDPLGNITGDSMEYSYSDAGYTSVENTLKNTYPGRTVTMHNVVDTRTGYMMQGGNNYLAMAGLSHQYGLFDEGKTGYPVDDRVGDYSGGMSATLDLDEHQYYTDRRARLVDTKVFMMSEPTLAKQMLMTYGAAGVSFYADNRCFTDNAKNHYISDENGANHDVLLVGWDDSYAKENFAGGRCGTPSRDGAWIIKNSWGEDTGENGYCYISYADSSISHSDATCYFVSTDLEANHLYQYDGVSMYYAGQMPQNGFYEANVFQVENGSSDEAVKEVSFFTSADTDYTVEIYKNPEKTGNVVTNPRTGTLIGKTSGSEDFQGYHTVSVSCNQMLEDGDCFSAVVFQKSDGANPLLFLEQSFLDRTWGPVSDTKVTDTTVDGYYFGEMVQSASLQAGESFIADASGDFMDLKGSLYETQNKSGNIMLHASTKDVCTLAVSENEVSLLPGETFKQIPSVVKGSYTGAFTYTSSDPSVAATQADGTVTAVGAGEARITITAADGAVVSYVVMVSVPISECTVSDIDVQQYTGQAVIPEVYVTYAEERLTEGEDYVVTAVNNIHAGTATATVSGIGFFKGSVEKPFEIRDGQMSISFNEAADYIYSAKEIVPEVTVSRGGTVLSAQEYELSCLNNRNAGTARLVVKAKSDGLTVKKTFTIAPRSLSTVSGQNIPDQVLSGGKAEPSVSMNYGTENLSAEKDYTLTYANNTAVRTAYGISRDPMVQVQGTGNYTGSLEFHFSIVNSVTPEGEISIKKAAISNVISTYYTGKPIAQQPGVVLQKKVLTEGVDYYLTYRDAKNGTNHTNAGKVTLVIHGMGNYSGTVEKKFNIRPVPMNSAYLDISLKQYVYSYTGSRVTPEYQVCLKDGTVIPAEGNYTVTPSGRGKAGVFTVAFKALTANKGGSGNFTGSRKLKAQISKDVIALEPINKSYSYTGSAIKPDISEFKDTAGNTYTVGREYKVTLQDNKAAGTAVLYLTGKGTNKGKTGYVTFTITPTAANSLTYTPIKEQKFKNKPVCPKPVIKNGRKKLSAGTDYTLYYFDNESTGTATVAVQFKGNYTGTKEMQFVIK